MLEKTNLHSLIKDKELLKEKGYIGGNWVESLSSKKFKVFNPSTGELIASVPDRGVKDTKEAIDKAHDALASWSKKTAKERANPDLLNGSRKRRITLGSGTQIQDLNRLLKQHKQMQRVMKKMKGGKLANMMRGLGGSQGQSAPGMPPFPKGKFPRF